MATQTVNEAFKGIFALMTRTEEFELEDFESQPGVWTPVPAKKGKGLRKIQSQQFTEKTNINSVNFYNNLDEITLKFDTNGNPIEVKKVIKRGKSLSNIDIFDNIEETKQVEQDKAIRLIIRQKELKIAAEKKKMQEAKRVAHEKKVIADEKKRIAAAELKQKEDAQKAADLEIERLMKQAEEKQKLEFEKAEHERKAKDAALKKKAEEAKGEEKAVELAKKIAAEKAAAQAKIIEEEKLILKLEEDKKLAEEKLALKAAEVKRLAEEKRLADEALEEKRVVEELNFAEEKTLVEEKLEEEEMASKRKSVAFVPTFDFSEEIAGRAIAASSVIESVFRTNPVLTKVLEGIKSIEENDPEVTEFDVKDYTLTTDLGLKIAKAIENNTFLRKLDLTNCGIQTATAIELAKALRMNESIRYLNLEGNQIGPKGMSELARTLATNKTLLELALAYQKSITSTGSEAENMFATSLASNFSLVKLGLSFNNAASRNSCDRSITRNKGIYRKLRSGIAPEDIPELQ